MLGNIKFRQSLPAKFLVISTIILTCFVRLNANPLEFDFELTSKSIEENKPVGTKIGTFTQQSANPEKLGFKIRPDFPSNINPVLWLDASDLSWASTQWDDRSGNNNHATMHGTVFGYPIIKQNSQNGLSLMHYPGSEGAYHSFNEINDIRTIFWVLRKKTGYGFMLAHNNRVHFHFKTGQFFWEKYASPNVYNGKLSLNGQLIDGTKADIPTKLSIISLRTSGNVTANNFSNDRNIKERFFNGDLGELIIFNNALSDFQIQQVESYLHFKWNLPLAYDPVNQPFSLSTNYELLSNQSFDRESFSNYEILVRASDNYGNHLDKKFNINILNVIEDLDSDGVEDPYDSDIDGDGLKNSVERNIGTDPTTANDFRAINKSPIAISSNAPLKIIENRPAGTIIGQLNVTDPDIWNTHNFSFISGFGDTHNHLFSINQSGTLKSSVQFDFESNSSTYYIRLKASDDFNASIEESLSIELVNEDTFSPLSLDSNLMLWLDASDRAKLDRGTYLGELGTPEDGESFKIWFDKSGKQHHARPLKGIPLWSKQLLKQKHGVNLNNASLVIDDSNLAFDNWNKLTTAIVFEHNDVNFANIIGKSNFAGWMNNDKDLAWSIFTQRLDNAYNLWGPAVITDTPANYYFNGGTNSGSRSLQSQDGGGLGLLIFSYAPNNFTVTINGQLIHHHSGLSGAIQPKPELNVTIGSFSDGRNMHKMKIGEVLVFNDALDNTDRQRVEGYLAHKWNLVHELDDYHPYKNGGIMDGTSTVISEELPVGTPIMQLSELDPDYNSSWSYSLTEANESNDNQLFTFFELQDWTPAQLNNLSLWLDAADTSTITADSDGNVSQWTDKSGNGNNAFQSNVNRMPTLTPNQLNAKAVIQFDGIDDFIDSSSLGITQSCFFAIVAKTNNNSTGRDFLFDGLSPSNARSIIALNHESKIQLWASNWSNSNFNTPSDYFVMTAIFNSNNSFLSLNGTTVNGLNPGTSSLSNGIRIGAHASLGDNLYGSIAEFLVIDDAVSTDTQRNVESYLANKWGLVDQLPASSRVGKDVVQTATSLDYETNATTYNLRVRASANGAV